MKNEFILKLNHHVLGGMELGIRMYVTRFNFSMENWNLTESGMIFFILLNLGQILLFEI